MENNEVREKRFERQWNNQKKKKNHKKKEVKRRETKEARREKKREKISRQYRGNRKLRSNWEQISGN